MATATIHICDVCGKEDKMKMEFTLKVCKNSGEVAREMDLCLSCCENLEKVISGGTPPPSAAKVTAEKKSPRNINLVKDVFRPVVKKIKDKKEELTGRQRRRLHAFFLESWLTELLMDALDGSDLKPQICHKGPEITFSDGSELKLKGSPSFELDWIIKDGALKHRVPVLFLCNGTEKSKIGQLKARSEITLLAYEYFNDGEDDWICGLMDVA
jgi:hypothetical protein